MLYQSASASRPDPDPTDEALAAKMARSGDAHAFTAIVERWQRPIHSLCTRMTGDLARAEDLTQETFARLFEKRAQYRPQPGAKFSTYLWKIAVNRCRDELKQRERRGQRESQSVSDSAPSNITPRTTAAENEEAEIVRQALQQLPETYRSVLVLRHYEGLKLREIAEVLEIPNGTVYSRMAEALKRMATILAPALGDPCPNSTSPPASETTSLSNPCHST